MVQTFRRVSQQEARYKLMGGIERCGRCRFFLKNNLCARVLGDVSPSAWCRFFSMEARAAMDAGGGAAATHSSGPPGLSLDLSFMTPGTLDPRITFTRASIGTYYDAAGVLQTSRVNTLLWSTDFNNAVWQLFNGATKGATVIGPDGNATGMTINFSTTAVSEVFQSLTIPAGSTFSVWARANTSSSFMLRMSVDLNSPVFTLTSQWQRFQFTGPSANSNCGFINVGSTAGSIDIAMPQLELGTPASVYAPTTTAANGAPRWDYDPVTHALRGLLIEEQRQNIYLQSSTLANAVWVVSGATSAAGTVAPDGSANAVFIKEDATNAQHLIAQVVGFTTGVPWTVSIYAKAGTRNILGMNGLGLGALSLIPQWNLTTGTDITTGSNATFFHGIQAIGNGWYRCWFTFTPTATTSVNFLLNNGPGAPTYPGDNVSGLYLWGACAELGAFATSYIPTTAAAVTRSIDVATMPTAAWYNQSVGTLFAAAIDGGWPPTGTNRNAGMASFDDGTSNGQNIIPLFMFNNGGTFAAPNVFTRVANTATSSVGGTNTNLSGVASVSKVAAYFSTAGTGISANGSVAATSAGGALPTVSRVMLGLGAGGVQALDGWLQRVQYWPRALTNAELQQVTT